jgi:hopanoid-associated phosphorylase
MTSSLRKFALASRLRVTFAVSERCAANPAPSVAAVMGLALEAKIAGGITVINDGKQTSNILRATLERGSRAIISFGIAGGLAPHLAPGQWVVAAAVVTNDQHHPVDQQWAEQLLKALPKAQHGIIAGVDAPVVTPAAKRLLYERTGAIAVDIESHLAARAAAAHGVPFAAFRVIVDPAHRLLPPGALVRLQGDGSLNLASVLRSIIGQPKQLPELIRLTMDAAMAASALRRGRARVGLNFAFPGPH